MRLAQLLVNIFFRFWSWVSKDQSLEVSVYCNNLQIFDDISTLEPPLYINTYTSGVKVFLSKREGFHKSQSILENMAD